MSQEKIFNLRAMGAEVVLTRSDVAKGHPEYYQDLGAVDRASDRRLLHQSVRESRQSEGARRNDRAGNLGADVAATRRRRRRRRFERHDRRARGVFQEARSARRDRARGSAGIDPCGVHRDRQNDAERVVARRGHRRGLHSVDLRFLADQARLHHSRRGVVLRSRASCCRRRGSSPDPRRARCSPRRCATAANRARRSAS